MKRTDKKDDFNTIVQLHKLMTDADNIDMILQGERVKVKPIFYDANQTWKKTEGQLGDFVLKYCGNGFEAFASFILLLLSVGIKT